MTEYSLQLIVFLKVLWIAGFAYLYGLGGISHKWLRRFVGSAWMMLGVFGFSHWEGHWNYWYLLYFPMLVGALSMGYGGVSFGEKVKRRFIYGFCCFLTFIPISIIDQAWALLVFHYLLCVLSSIILGVFNPFKDARHEESLIAVCISIVPLFTV